MTKALKRFGRQESKALWAWCCPHAWCCDDVVSEAADLTDTLNPKLHSYTVFAQLCAHVNNSESTEALEASAVPPLCFSHAAPTPPCSSLIFSLPLLKGASGSSATPHPQWPPEEFLLCSLWMCRVCSFHSFLNESVQPVVRPTATQVLCRRCRCLRRPEK